MHKDNMAKITKFIASILFVLLGVGTVSVHAQTTSYKITRLGGANRQETAIKIADQVSSGTLENIILSTGGNFPDALSGGVYAYKLGAPILLVGNSVEDSKETLDYIESKLDKNGTISVFGGIGVVKQEILDYLKTKGYNNFQRLGGTDRFDTNSIITAKLNVEKGTPIMLVNANDFPDVLCISSIAAIKGYPIVITEPTKLSDSAKSIIKDIQPSKVYQIDGEGALSKQVETDVKTAIQDISGSSLVKITGTNRYDNSVKICNTFDLKTTNYILATGDSFPDGITGAVLAAKLNAQILLVNDKNFKNQSAHLFSKDITNISILGGIGAVSQGIEDGISSAMVGFDCASARTYDESKTLKDLGYSFVARYYFEYDPSVAWKYNLTLQEAKDISKAGLKIVAVFQDGGKDKPSYFTYDQGVKDCKKAIKNATDVGQTPGTPIYFAVDTQAEGSDLKQIETYFDGIKATMSSAANNQWKIGVYGSYSVVNDIYNKLGTDTYIWQTPSWSNGKLSPNYNIYQAQINQTEGKIGIDIDRANVAKGNDVGGFQIP